MKIPDWWASLLLAAAAWRTFQLLANDDILDWPRRRLLRLGDWHDGDHVSQVPAEYRQKWGDWLKCPYCAGFWIGLAWWGAWQITGHWTLVAAAPFAISLGVIALARLYSD